MYGYGYRYNSGLVLGAGGGAPFVNTYSLDFDGMDDYVDVGTSLNLGTDSTISMWIKRGRVSTTEMLLGEDTYSFDLTSYISASNTLIFKIGTFDSTFNASPISTILNDTTNWIHICWVRSGDSVELFLNGVSMQTKTGFGAVTNTRFDTIAAKPTGALPFMGNIDEVAAWNTDTIIASDIYNGGNPTDLNLLDAPPVYWYRMGDNGSYKSPQWLIPNNSNKDKVSNYTFQLDGINDYIDCGDSDVFSFGDGATDSAFSVSTWFKMSSFNTNNVVFSKDSGLPSREYAIGFFGASKKLRFYIKNQGGNSQQSIDSTTLFALDTWYNVVCTYDGSGGSNAADGMNIYVNGALETPTSIIKGTYVAMSNTTAPVNIGRYGAAASPLPATVDEVSVYDSELLQADVDSIYVDGEPTTLPSGAVAHWKMGENATLLTQWTIPDEVGSNDGASVNMNFLDRIGEAPNSTGNALSFNMDSGDRLEDTP